MTAKTASVFVPQELTWPEAPPPMSVTHSFWVYAVRSRPSRRKPTDRSGKWMIFPKRPEADALWEVIARATFDGKLGSASKCGTARPNPNAFDPSSTVICVYTPDFDDGEDVMRVRKTLQELGVTWKIPYKLDSTTLAGRYAVRGDRRTTVLWA